MIFQKEPEDWKELQILTRQLFLELGCHSEMDKRITTARGTVDIDVYVEDSASTPSSIYLIECKYWNTRIPKTIVHSLRTVVNDSGANRGYVVSKVGFQSGAVVAAEFSNIELVTWEQLQELFKARWIEALKNRITSTAMKINRYSGDDFIGLERMTEEKRKNSLLELSFRIGCLIPTECFIANGTEEIGFPWKLTDPDSVFLEEKRIVSVSTLREYYEFVITSCESLDSLIKKLTTK